MNITENELLAEIQASLTPDLDESCEVCVPMIVALNSSYERHVVSEMLNKQVSEGKLISHDAIYNGRRVKAYRKV